MKANEDRRKRAPLTELTVAAWLYIWWLGCCDDRVSVEILKLEVFSLTSTSVSVGVCGSEASDNRRSSIGSNLNVKHVRTRWVKHIRCSDPQVSILWVNQVKCRIRSKLTLLPVRLSILMYLSSREWKDARDFKMIIKITNYRHSSGRIYKKKMLIVTKYLRNSKKLKSSHEKSVKIQSNQPWRRQ